MIDRLRNEHDKLRQIAATLVQLVSGNGHCDLEMLANCRWELARMLLQHLALEDRHLYSRLEADPRPHVSLQAKRYRTELEASYAHYQAHTDHWTTEAVAADWAGYARAVRANVEAMLNRLDREEAILYPLIAEAPAAAARKPTDRNWAGDGWVFRAKIRGS